MVSPMYWLPSCCKTLRLTKLYVASSCKEDVVLMQVSYPENNNIVPHAHSAYHDSKAKDFSIRNGVDEGEESINYTGVSIYVKDPRVCHVSLHAIVVAN